MPDASTSGSELDDMPPAQITMAPDTCRYTVTNCLYSSIVLMHMHVFVDRLTWITIINFINFLSVILQRVMRLLSSMF